MSEDDYSSVSPRQSRNQRNPLQRTTSFTSTPKSIATRNGITASTSGIDANDLDTSLRQRSASLPRFVAAPRINQNDGNLTIVSTPPARVSGARSPFGSISSSHSTITALAASSPETKAFLSDALDEVCSDFERTLERASMGRKRHKSIDCNINGGRIFDDLLTITSIDSCDSNNNHHYHHNHYDYNYYNHYNHYNHHYQPIAERHSWKNSATSQNCHQDAVTGKFLKSNEIIPFHSKMLQLTF